MVPMRYMGMISCLLMGSGFIMFRGFPVMMSRVLIMFRRQFVVFSGFVMIVFAFWHSRDEMIV